MNSKISLIILNPVYFNLRLIKTQLNFFFYIIVNLEPQLFYFDPLHLSMDA